jgi:Ca2+ transporting ATPase
VALETQVPNNPEYIELLKMNACVNGTAELFPEEKGSSTEIAILKYMKRCGIEYRKYRESHPTMFKYPFSSARKRMSVVLEYNGSQIILVKGASEMVMNSCSDWLNPETNEIEAITPSKRKEMDDAIIGMANKSLRTLCLAYKKLRPTSDLETKDEKGVFEIEKSELICLAIIGVKDIARPEVPEAIRKCKIAGITIRMVTGDNLLTAKAIAE